MNFLSFNHSVLNHFGEAGKKEYLLVNNNGTYCSSTIINCHSRKYHGLLVAMLPQFNEDHHVMLSNLDETIIRGSSKHELAVHQYPDTIYPEGHLYLLDFNLDRIPVWNYQAEDISFRKSIVLSDNSDSIFIKYEVLKASRSFRLQLRPFLAFRNIHSLGRAKLEVDPKLTLVENGVRLQPFEDFPAISLQLSKKSRFTPSPDWYYEQEYTEELRRGYAFREDLYVPGYFEITMRPGDHLIFSAGLETSGIRRGKRKFDLLAGQQMQIGNFDDCLLKAASQFVIQRKNKTRIIAGWHWFGSWARDTFIAIPGLVNAVERKTLLDVVDTMLADLKDGLFPNSGNASSGHYHSIDAPLWFFRALQSLYKPGELSAMWKKYGKPMKSILFHFRDGTRYSIKMEKNGLISTSNTDLALTWMDAVVDQRPVTLRNGMAVEVNALWYNAICFAVEAATEARDRQFLSEWEKLIAQVSSSFQTTFRDADKGYLADCVTDTGKDWSLRPNQVIAVALPYSPVDPNTRRSVIEVVTNELLTPRGLRTLSSHHPAYKGSCSGNQSERDRAYHQGTVWPWLLGYYAEGYLKTYKKEGVSFIRSLYDDFESTAFEHGIGSVSEIYDGDPPYYPRGAISQAWSISELLRIKELIGQYQEEEVKQEEEQPLTIH